LKFGANTQFFVFLYKNIKLLKAINIVKPNAYALKM